MNIDRKIKTIKARQILDCKARPMLEVDVFTEGGYMGRGSAPTGTSVGMYESYIIRDGVPGEYGGMGVHKAARIVEEEIAPKLAGMDVCDQKAIDETMLALDGTPNKSKLGGIPSTAFPSPACAQPRRRIICQSTDISQESR